MKSNNLKRCNFYDNSPLFKNAWEGVFLQGEAGTIYTIENGTDSRNDW